MKAADIEDAAVLDAIRKHMRPIGASRWDVYPEFAFPEKIVRAKVDKMIRRGILTGCCCGCRGDFTIAGEDTPESEESKRRGEAFGKRLQAVADRITTRK